MRLLPATGPAAGAGLGRRARRDRPTPRPRPPASLYQTERGQVAAARDLNSSPALVALYGPILDVHSLGELAMTKMTVTYAVFLMASVRRPGPPPHPRRGGVRARRAARRHRSRSRPRRSRRCDAGRSARLALVLGCSPPWPTSPGVCPSPAPCAFGASWFGLGLVATGIGAVTSQLSASARTCGAVSAGTLAALFLLRAVGDTTSASWLSWLSPLGWSTQLRAWSHPRGWILLLDLGLAAVLVAVAVALRRRRDLGSGLLPERPGPATGSPRLADALALNVRVHTPPAWPCGPSAAP